MRPDWTNGDAGTAASETTVPLTRRPKMARPAGTVLPGFARILAYPIVGFVPEPEPVSETPPRSTKENGVAGSAAIFVTNTSLPPAVVAPRKADDDVAPVMYT